jgi:hypothetical protein
MKGTKDMKESERQSGILTCGPRGSKNGLHGRGRIKNESFERVDLISPSQAFR